MEHFKQFLKEQKNTHMTHIEDKVLYGGVKGTREAIFALRDLRDMLGGVSSSKLSTKWDGAPAVFCGQDPRDGEFFVAKKGVFAKSPKVYKTDEEIDADMSGDLATKMKLALKHLPELGIKGVIQGDFLFGGGDVDTKTIDGQKFTTFHPNTIIYAIPYDQAKEVRKAKMGVVWHTTYKGKDFESMKASYGVDVSKFKKSTAVWSQDAMLRDVSGATMSKQETKEVNEYLKTSGRIFQKIAGSTLRQLEGNQDLAQKIEQYGNTFVREGQIIPDSKRHVKGLIKWIREKYQKEIDSKKSDKGKANWEAKQKDILSFFSEKNQKNLVLMFDLQKNIVFAKLKLINKLNSISNIDAFVQTKSGYKTTGAEGFVAIDELGGDAVKLVDRLEFSYNNFSPDVLKGWDKPKR
jgi:hypothetical protein